jgi:hypothetical protein
MITAGGLELPIPMPRTEQQETVPWSLSFLSTSAQKWYGSGGRGFMRGGSLVTSIALMPWPLARPVRRRIAL